MATILNIETSTAVCSVAVSSDGAVVWHAVCYDGRQHATHLPVFVAQALEAVQTSDLSLAAVAVSAGPGSYTGLRIGVATAKGVCYGRDLPLIAVPTLSVLCVPVLRTIPLAADALLCPMLDARRMEVYSMLVDSSLHEVRGVMAEVITAGCYDAYLSKHDVYFFGDGSAKCSSVLRHPRAHFLPDVVPLADEMAPLSERAYAAGQFVDLAYYTPQYLKEAHTTAPRRGLQPLVP